MADRCIAAKGSEIFSARACQANPPPIQLKSRACVGSASGGGKFRYIFTRQSKPAAPRGRAPTNPSLLDPRSKNASQPATVPAILQLKGMTKGPLQTAITAAALACLVLQRVSLLSSFARAGAIESPNEDTIDHLIRRRNGASTSTSQRPLHVQDGERNDATVPGEETTNDSKFYDFADWSNDDVSSLVCLVHFFEHILC